MKQEANSQLKEQTIAFKDKADKYEKTIKSLTAENEQLKESLVDLEANVQSLGLYLQNEKDKNEELTYKTNKEIKWLEDDLNNLKKKSLEEKEKLKNELGTKIEELSSELKKSRLQLNENEVKSKALEDSSRDEIIKMERENAILKQENTLLKNQNDEINKRYQEQKNNYENIIVNLQTKAFQTDNGEIQKKIEEVKSFYEDDKKKSEENFIKKTQHHLDQLTNGLNKNCAIDPVNITSTKKILNQMMDCICRINNGIGFFCKITLYNKIMNVLMTNYNIINENYWK